MLPAPGPAFVGEMAGTASRWLDLPVDEEAQGLADRTTVDHHLRWRLRNRRPDAAAVTVIADVWLAGRPCPIDPRTVSATLTPGPRRLALSERVRLCGLRLRDPDALDRVTASPNDLAYVRDDFAGAAQQYQAAIADHPDDIEKWAGLALALLANASGT